MLTLYTYIYIHLQIGQKKQPSLRSNSSLEAELFADHVESNHAATRRNKGCSKPWKGDIYIYICHDSKPHSYGKTIGKWWFNGGFLGFYGILWDLPSGKCLHSNGSHHF